MASIRDGSVLLRVRSQLAGCQPCAAGGGCGGSALLRFLRPSQTLLRVPTQAPLRVGEQVLLSVPERWLLVRVLLVYGVPLGGLIAGALAGELSGGNMAAVGGGAVGLMAGWIAVMVAARHRGETGTAITARRRATATSLRVNMPVAGD